MQFRDSRILFWAIGIFAAFAVFILIGQLVTRRWSAEIWRIFGIQALTTLWILGAAWAGGWVFVAAIAATAAVSSHELTGTLGRLGLPVRRFGVAAVSVAYCVGAAFSIVWLLYVFLAFALLLMFHPVFGGELKNAWARASNSLLATVYPGMCLAFAVVLAGLGNGFGDFVYLYAVLEINDACASLVGRFAGRHPYAPVLSPRKTKEGAAAGIVGATVAGALLSFLLAGVGTAAGAVIGLGLGILGQAADLAASAIKRQAGIKDFAHTIPTQGGVLDVYDALIFSLPPWYFLVQIIKFRPASVW